MGIYQKIFKKKPEYFRAPQFSLDKELLDILNKNNFKYDYSTVQFSISQSIFFPSRFFLYLSQSTILRYIKKNHLKISEIPNSSFMLPISMFSLKLFPLLLFKILTRLSLIFKKDKKLIFLMHSYEVNDSNIRKLNRFLRSLK